VTRDVWFWVTAIGIVAAIGAGGYFRGRTAGRNDPRSHFPPPEEP